MQITLLSITPDAEKHIAYCARVSSDNQNNPEYDKLFKYLIKHQHWSPFEMAHAVFEIETSRAIAAQILRHRSFSFQEFSQRYSGNLEGFEFVKGRKQAEKNRQSSTEDLDFATAEKFKGFQYRITMYAENLYYQALSAGVAREQARMLLPLSAKTTIIMSGNIRSWIHYCQLRCKEDTQLEHRQIALQIRDTLSRELPTLSVALGWTTE